MKIAATSALLASSCFTFTTQKIFEEKLFLSEVATETQATELYQAFDQVPCNYITENANWYSLINTSNTTAYYSSANSTATDGAYYTFCQNLDSTQFSNLGTNCSGNYLATVVVNGVCTLNADSSSSGNYPSAVQGQSALSLVYTNSDNQTNNGTTSLTVNLICDSAQTTPLYGNLTCTNGTCVTSLTSNTNLACPIYTQNALIQFIYQYRFWWGTAFMVLGILIAFFGRYLLKGVVFIAGTVFVCFLILIIFYSTFLSDKTASWIGWLVISLSILLGLVAGYFLAKYDKIEAAILGAWGGFALGVILNETVLYLVGSVALFWCINVGLALVGAVLGFFLFNPVIIIGTSFIGSFLTMRGISLYAGGFPNEYVLITQIKNGAVDNIDPTFYGYLAGILVMTVLASWVQYKLFHRMDEHKKHPYHQLN